MRVLCKCNRFYVNPEHADFVQNGVPLCRAATCSKVAEHRAAGLHYEDDHLPDHIHAREMADAAA